VLLVETVGVGQSETAVANLTDLFLLLALPGSGDELQGIKRGIMEMADLVVVTKADGDQARLADRARVQLASALRLLHGHREAPQVLAVSALEGIGIEAVAETCMKLQQQRIDDGTFDSRRGRQALHWLWTLVDEGLRALVHRASNGAIAAIEEDVRAGRMSVIAGAHQILASHTSG
jgi:LAO/AO transport system kinase